MKLNEESSDFVYLGKRIDKALDYIQNNKSNLLDWFKQYVEIPYQDIMSGELELEEEDYTFDYLDSLLDDLEEKFNIILEKQNKMDNEFKRMQELAGLPITENKVEETKETINENFVGIPAINNIFEREKTDYEIAFEHFTEGTSLNEVEEELEEAHPLEGGPGYMTKHHAGVLTRLIHDLEKEDTSKFSESNLENYEKTLSSLKAALEASKAKYKEETGKELEGTLNENFIQGDETVKNQLKTYFEEMAKNYPENLASVLTGLVMGEDPTFEDFVSRVSNDISGDDKPFGLD